MTGWNWRRWRLRVVGLVYLMLMLKGLRLLYESRQLARSSEQSAQETKVKQAPKYRVKTFEGLPTAGENHIFFVETSCDLQNASALRLTPRAACALEAAATLHPTRVVYLAHTCPVPSEALARGEGAPEHALAALHRPNVRLWPVNYHALLAGSPLEAPKASLVVLYHSLWPEAHGSDYLRFLLLWGFGGTYLDQDVLLIRSLGNMTNFACTESAIGVSTAVMDFALNDVGRRLVKASVEAMQYFPPKKWSDRGIEFFTRALENVCGVNDIDRRINDCKGFHLFPTVLFHPLPLEMWKKYFREENNEEVMQLINSAIGIKVWNDLSRNATVHTSSMQPYAQLARKVCPNVVAAVGEVM